MKGFKRDKWDQVIDNDNGWWRCKKVQIGSQRRDPIWKFFIIGQYNQYYEIKKFTTEYVAQFFDDLMTTDKGKSMIFNSLFRRV